jgi:serine/threonine protein kinase
MGEVYQAKDLRFGPEVASKVLPEEFAKDAGRVARFQREAKLLASLSHANIPAIYGLEDLSGGDSRTAAQAAASSVVRGTAFSRSWP